MGRSLQVAHPLRAFPMKNIAYLCAGLGLLFFLESTFVLTKFVETLSLCSHSNYVEIRSENHLLNGRRHKCMQDHELEFQPSLLTTPDVCKSVFHEADLFDGDGGLYFMHPHDSFPKNTSSSNLKESANMDTMCPLKCDSITLKDASSTDVIAYEKVSLKETGWTITYYIAACLAFVSSLILSILCFAYFYREKIVPSGFDGFISIWLMIHAVVDLAVTVLIPIVIGIYSATRNTLGETDAHTCKVPDDAVSYFTVNSNSIFQNYYFSRALFLVLFSYRADQYMKLGLVEGAMTMKTHY